MFSDVSLVYLVLDLDQNLVRRLLIGLFLSRMNVVFYLVNVKQQKPNAAPIASHFRNGFKSVFEFILRRYPDVMIGVLIPTNECLVVKPSTIPDSTVV